MMSNSAKPTAFLDRDGVIIRDFGYVYRPDDLVFVDGAPQAIRKLNELGYRVIVVTNQSGVARGYFGIDELEAFHAVMSERLGSFGARLDAIYHCPYHPEGVVEAFRCDHPDRKPKPGMLLRAMSDFAVDREASFLIGDKDTDIEAAKAAEVAGFLFDPETSLLDFVETLISNGSLNTPHGARVVS